MDYDFLNNQENLIWNLRQEGKTYKAIGEQLSISPVKIGQLYRELERIIERRTVPVYTQHEMSEVKRKLEWNEREIYRLRDFARYQLAKLEALEKTAFYTDKGH